MLEKIKKRLAEIREERVNSQLTLGEFISFLSGVDPDLPVICDTGQGVGEAMSYRGYYEDLSFSPSEKSTVQQVLSEASSSLGQTYHGYKGGDFLMTKSTPIWLAYYGGTGRKIISSELRNGVVFLTTGEDE